MLVSMPVWIYCPPGPIELVPTSEWIKSQSSIIRVVLCPEPQIL